MKTRITNQNNVECRLIHSLEKILPLTEPVGEEKGGSVLKNQTYNFQVALRSFAPQGAGTVFVRVSGPLEKYITVRKEALAPATVIPHDADDYYVTKDVTLIPDALLPCDKGLYVPHGQWRAVWISVQLDGTVGSGVYSTDIEVVGLDGTVHAKLTHMLEIIDAVAPKNDLKLTNWMHYDGICRIHRVQPFTDAFYEVFKGYLQQYVSSGFNMLLTPLFTPPLDTDVGRERMTVQLVKVWKDENGYRFDFSALESFITFVLARGIEYIEFSHLFTQWGGKACPKIIVEIDGKEEKCFGWDAPSDSEEYKRFLDAFLPQLMRVIDKLGIRERCYFHLTDEPNATHEEYYAKCRALVKSHVGDIPVMDAIELYSYYEKGLVDLPVVFVKGYEEFAKRDTQNIFVYNCCYPAGEYYSNRFINMPSQRTRVLGFQLYATGVKGYLHWGFNFYNSCRSRYAINPYAVTDAGGFPCGDPFIVYPDEENGGAHGSVRLEAVKEGFQDYCALRLLETFVGRAEVCCLLSEWGLDGYAVYPRSAEKHVRFREKINALIKTYCENKE